MATYKKTGSKVKTSKENVESSSTTAEVFNTLDKSASRSEQWVIQNQKAIFSVIALIVIGILGYLAYQKFIKIPKETEAANELAFPKVYFDDALKNGSTTLRDSLFLLGLNGNDGNYGFVDIAEKYSGTKAANLANYHIGITHLKMKQYEEAIEYLDKFSANDELITPIALGSIGDAFSDIDQLEDALDYYQKAAEIKNNSFSTPFYLFKAGAIAMEIKKHKVALAVYKRIKNEFPDTPEARDIDVHIGRATFATKE